MNDTPNLLGGTRPITPLVIIALFVLLTDAVATVALIQTQGSVQVALTVFVIAFPSVIVTLFFATLWYKPQVLYSPKEYGESTGPEAFALAMQVRAPTLLGDPGQDDIITENHMALIHSSWRYPKRDEEFGRSVYVFHAVVRAQDSVLDKIEYVVYHLTSGWPNPVQTTTDRASNFKLKELAWAEITLHAEVKVKGQQDLIRLSRYINLTMTGPTI
jgi:hypothetical protein